MVASTPSERNAKAYNTVASIIIDKAPYEVNAYMAAPNNTSKGVIRDIDPSLDQDELPRLIVQPRNPTVIGVRRIKSISSVIVLFDGFKVPEYVKCGPSLVKCSQVPVEEASSEHPAKKRAIVDSAGSSSAMKAKSEIKDVIESLSITIGAIKATLDGLVEGFSSLQSPT
ncbi:hypothetical protein MTO96_008006 [Rhipicephalus appendiculatus]